MMMTTGRPGGRIRAVRPRLRTRGGRRFRRHWGLRFRLDRFAVPLRVFEEVISLYEIIDCKEVFAREEPCATTNDLLELDHRVDGPEQDDVATVCQALQYLHGRLRPIAPTGSMNTNRRPV
jgi:hypothetical protein